jgi:magnesium chelatase subunit I
VKKLGATEPAAMASAMEFVLEGLHLGKKLNKDMKSGAMRYRGMS